MRRASKVDRTQAEIVNALRQAGCLVHVTSRLGGGFPDAVVRLPGRVAGQRLWLVEIKDGSAAPSAQALTPAEVWFHDLWKGSTVILSSVDDALEWARVSP